MEVGPDDVARTVAKMAGIPEARLLADGRGRQVDFSNAVVVLTTNLGAAEATRITSGAVGFGAAERSAPPLERALDAARTALPPELWNRLDERIVLAPLSRPDVARIGKLLVARSSARLEAERKIRLEATEAAIQHVLDQGGYDAALGARPMRGALQRLVEAPVAELVLSGEAGPGDTVRVDAVDGKLAFERVGRPGSGARASGAG